MDQQISLFDSDPTPVLTASDPNAFGCCSRYRECSSAAQCLIADRDYSLHCSYRKKLEAGRRFYGKTASGFDLSQYAGIRQRADALSAGVRKVFDRIVIDLCEYNRSAPYCIVRNQHTSKLSSVGLFDFRPLGSLFTRLVSYRSFLLPMLNPSPLLVQLKQDYSDYTAKNLTRERPVLKDYVLSRLNSDLSPLRDLLAEPYLLIFPKPECTCYIEKLYQDDERYLGGYDKRIYPRSPLAEDGLLSASDLEKEDTRRIKLSRGYPPEERERLLNEILQAQQERRKSASEKNEASEPESPKTCRNGNPVTPLWNLKFAITGTLRIKRQEASIEILLRGGQVTKGVGSADCLVFSPRGWSEQNGGVASQKTQKAAELQSCGKNIEIISEDDFYSLLGDFLYARPVPPPTQKPPAIHTGG